MYWAVVSSVNQSLARRRWIRLTATDKRSNCSNRLPYCEENHHLYLAAATAQDLQLAAAVAQIRYGRGTDMVRTRYGRSMGTIRIQDTVRHVIGIFNKQFGIQHVDSSTHPYRTYAYVCTIYMPACNLHLCTIYMSIIIHGAAFFQFMHADTL